MAKPVEMYSSFGTLLKLYWSIQSAVEDHNISYNKLNDLIKTNKVYKGKRFKMYYSEKNIIGSNFYPIQQYNKKTGEVISQFSTIVEATYALDYSRNAIGRCISYDLEDKYGLHWRKIHRIL